MQKRLRSSPLILSVVAAVAVVILTVAPGVVISARSAARQTRAVIDGLRDPAYWPFDALSPFNQPITDWARFERIDAPALKLDAPKIACDDVVYIARPGDMPVKLVVRGRRDPAARMRLPPHARLALSQETTGRFVGVQLLIDPTHSFVIEMTSARLTDAGDLHVSNFYRNNLRGLGVYPKRHGFRAFGGSALAGLIRRAELQAGIPHALAIAVRRNALSRDTPSGKPYIWPACDADNNWNQPPNRNGYATTGNLYLGSLLAIPPGVDLATLDIDPSGPAWKIAHALQRYGGYVVDSTTDAFALLAEAQVADELPDGIEAQLAKVVAQLQRVTNNTEQSPAGGGDPLAPTPPPLLPLR